jgi:hypothetical protein
LVFQVEQIGLKQRVGRIDKVHAVSDKVVSLKVWRERPYRHTP